MVQTSVSFTYLRFVVLRLLFGDQRTPCTLRNEDLPLNFLRTALKLSEPYPSRSHDVDIEVLTSASYVVSHAFYNLALFEAEHGLVKVSCSGEDLKEAR